MRSEARKKAQSEYQKKLKRILLVFSINELELYNEAMEKANKEGTTFHNWVKSLIREELEEH